MTLLEIYNIDVKKIKKEAKMKAEVEFNKDKRVLEQILKKLMFNVELTKSKFKCRESGERYAVFYSHVFPNCNYVDSFKIDDVMHYITVNDYISFYDNHKWLNDDLHDFGLTKLAFYINVENQNHGGLNVDSMAIINVRAEYELM